MNISFEQPAIEHLTYWVQHDRRIAVKILQLINACIRDPYQGVGKPEPLKHQLQGMWSRRIDQEHRLVYYFRDEQIVIVSCRFHYT